jgi:hypothetical protein
MEDLGVSHLSMEDIIPKVLNRYDGMVLGGNDFLYTTDLQSHPMSYFLYEYGRLLVSLGLDTIYLENHYINEPLQTRGLIGHVMYCAYLYNLRVIGIEGKFTPEQYKFYTGVDITDDWTTVAYATAPRLNRLNIITSHIVPYTRKGKFLLFCGMSHVNDETTVTTCKGIKNFLNVPGVGCMFSTVNAMTPGKPFSDPVSSYERPADYLIELVSKSVSNDRLYIDATTWCYVHDVLFFYKTVYHMMTHVKKPVSVKSLWNVPTTIFPPIYRMYMDDMIKRDPRLSLPDSELNDVCSYIHFTLYLRKEVPSRQQVAQGLRFLTENNLYDIVDSWIEWVKKMTTHKDLDTVLLTALSDIIFLEYKKLSTDRHEDRYILYLKNKYRKQLERPETKFYTVIRIMKSLSLHYPTSKLLDRIL